MSADLEKIKGMLADRALEVCRRLIPGGHEERGEWVCGDINGSPGKSFRVHLSGPKLGMWGDFADLEHYRGRNFLGLWTACRGGDFKKAIGEVKQFLGLRDEWQRKCGHSESVAGRGSKKLEDRFVPVRDGGRVMKWLSEHRKIGIEAIKAYRIGESIEGDFCVFPFYGADGHLEMLKFMDPYTDRDQRKIRTEPVGCAKKLLFGWQAVLPDQAELCITEGELDAMAMMTVCGVRAVSVPFGAKSTGMDGKNPNDAWIEHDYEQLQRFEEIYLCMDSDEPGLKAAHDLVPRLGRHRCRLVRWPENQKDANGCLLSGMVPKDMADLLLESADFKPEELLKPSDFEQEIWEEFNPDKFKKSDGDDTPWAINFHFREKELTIWHGYNGHGKTMLLNHLLNHFAYNGRKICVASLEFPAAQTFQNIERQALGKSKPQDREEHNAAVAWMDKQFWIYAHIGPAKICDIMDVFTFTAMKYGINHFVLDSLMMLDGVKGDDYGPQRELCQALKAFAMEFSCHVHLVCHSKKPDAKHPENKCWPSKYDISGSGDISNVADNVMCVWRHIEKEEKLHAASDMARAGLEDEAEKLKNLFQHREDALLVVQKNRKTGELIKRRLWFDKGAIGSWQYYDEKGNPGVRYMEASSENNGHAAEV